MDKKSLTPIYKNRVGKISHYKLCRIVYQNKNSNIFHTLKYNFFKNSDIIERIKISNLHSIHDYDLITEKMQELLATV